MVSKKIIAIVVVIAVLAVGVGVWANGSASTDDSLNGQEVNLAAAASLKNVFDEKMDDENTQNEFLNSKISSGEISKDKMKKGVYKIQRKGNSYLIEDIK